MKHIEDKKVGDIMTYGVVTVPKYANIIRVIRIFAKGRVHGVVVVGKEGKASGIITEIDIFRAFGHDFTDVTAEDIMSKPLRTIDINATISEAAEIMREGGFHRLILDQNGYPKGIISVTDITRAILRAYVISYHVLP